MLSKEDLRQFAQGVSPQLDVECDQLLQTAASQLTDRNKPQSHVVLILDKVCSLSEYKPKSGTCYHLSYLFRRKKFISRGCFAVPSKVAMGEHLHLKILLCQPDAFSTLSYWTQHSKRGEKKLNRADVIHSYMFLWWLSIVLLTCSVSD